jgi:hypothetical protein
VARNRRNPTYHHFEPVIGLSGTLHRCLLCGDDRTHVTHSKMLCGGRHPNPKLHSLLQCGREAGHNSGFHAYRASAEGSLVTWSTL